jgi:hypothetical protein
MTGDANTGRWLRAAGWFLFVSYAIGSPLFALVEFRTGMFSQKFAYSPGFLYLVSGTQFVCALLLFRRSVAPFSIAILTVLSIGAAYSHFRIESPLTALPAVAYTVLQVWYGFGVRRKEGALR